MFRSIFSKILVSYILITIVSLTFISLTIGIFFRNQIISQEREFLRTRSNEINEWSDLLVKGEIKKKEFDTNMKIMERTDGVKIKFVPKKPGDKLMGIYESPDDGTVGKKVVSDVLQGKERFIVTNLKNTEKPYVILGTPFKDNKGIQGAIFLYSPVDKMNSRINQLYKQIARAFLSISIPMILLLYYASKKFTTPLIKMSTVADCISHGDFEQRVELIGDDEVGLLADSLNNMAEKLQKLEQMRKDFIANVSHELRTPLTTIRANTQGILDGIIEGDEMEQYLNVTLDETKRLTDMVNELIDMSQLDKNNLKLNIKEADIKDIILQVIKQMKLKALEKNQSLDIEVSDDLTGKIDGNRFRQVLINIIDNAIKFTPENGKITVKAARENSMLKVEIADTGCGIPKEHQDFIFERFYKTGNSKGAGIGLYLSKHIVEAHGGEIFVESESGKGTKFFIKIPI